MPNCSNCDEVAANRAQQGTVDLAISRLTDGTLELRVSTRSRVWQLGCFLAVAAAACAVGWPGGVRNAATPESSKRSCPAHEDESLLASSCLPWLLAAAAAWLLVWDLVFRVCEEAVCALPGGVGYILERRSGSSLKLAPTLLLPLPSSAPQAASAAAGKDVTRTPTGSSTSSKGRAARPWAWQRVQLELGVVRRRQRFIDGRDVLYVTLSEAISSIDVRYFLAFALRDQAGGGGPGGAGGCLAVPFEALLPHLRLKHLTRMYQALLQHQQQEEARQW